ncbi:MAG TPA: hypothetical protein PLS03_04130 [Terrimicrobiaceae bacterium]|nr:hypothetical protein [Terrimicrobiaceae bacterium]
MNSLALENAVIVTPGTLAGPEERALAALIDEIQARTRLRLPVLADDPGDGRPVIYLGRAEALQAAFGLAAGPVSGGLPAEGFSVRAEGSRVLLAGNDARGVLYAAGHFLRALCTGRDAIVLPLPYAETTAPRWPLRGHQLGYRPLPNCYTGWDVAQWEQYIRELALWGANAIELLPPETGGPPDSPHFPLPRLEMMAEMARIIASYGLDVWIWYPALADYSTPEKCAAGIAEWGRVFSRLCRIDAVLVPGGDPGDTPLHLLLPFLEKQTANLRRFHPDAAMWLSPQGFKGAEMQAFFAHLQTASPDWLAGVVFGPWVHLDLAEFRAQVPERYPVRFYPDITHTRHCQYPVPDWDLAFALTQGRESVCPRPEGMANILRRLQPHTIGAVCYSEGCHDDVNKAVWSALSWNPDADVTEVLRSYGRFFLGARWADPFAQGLLALERNWQGALLANEGVNPTLQSFQAMEDAADPHLLKNWRFLQPLFRAYIDAYTRLRLIHETALEQLALDALREAGFKGAVTAMAEAEAVLDRAVTAPPGRAWRTRIFQLAEALYQSIHHKLSVSLYQALATGRGAHLDSLDWPLNSRLWLKDRFAALRALPSESERLAGLREILEWSNPGPGGFYDNMGALPMTPRLRRGPGPVEDPAFIHSSMTGCLYLTQEPMTLRYSCLSMAWSLNDEPLVMVYDGLDPGAAYEVQVIYSQNEYKNKIRLVANGALEVHGYIDKPDPVAPLRFDIPLEATAGGVLTLSWNREPGLGGEGQGCHVTEIWLMRKDREAFAAEAERKWEYAR